jgi:hypothetical protein
MVYVDSPELSLNVGNVTDIIVISNSTVDAGDTGDGHPFVYGEWSFKDGILETANTPSAPDGGLRVSTIWARQR